MPKFLKFSKKRREKFAFSPSPPIALRVNQILKEYQLSYINPDRIFCVESTGSKSRAYARCWGLSRIWQDALGVKAAYILEVTHQFFKLNGRQQDEVLIHELAHIPKNFSGALVGHYGIEKRMREMAKRINTNVK
ncbi:metallopeptidase [Candidatus Microgenomates bacterium]|nr:metallopeptidase [Candidatus Microgenomates bacterium]